MFKRLLSVALFMTFASVVSAATFNVSNPAEFQAALTVAQANGENDVINVAAGDYPITATLTYTTATPSEDFTLEILGAGSDLVTLDGLGARSILRIDTTAVVDDDNIGIRITNMTFINGNAVGDPSDGGALAITLDDQGAPGSNGADFVEISGCEFYDNAADDDGGAIAFKGDVSEFLTTSVNKGVTFRDLTIENNEARGVAGGAPFGTGGGIFAEGGTGTVFYFDDVEFITNTALSEGGGVAIYGIIGVATGIVNFENFGFFGNRAPGAFARGGGAFVTAGDLNLSKGGFVDNLAASEGGGVYLAEFTRLLSENVGFVSNQAGLAGGGIGTDVAAASGIALINNTFISNLSSGSGGGIYIARDVPGDVWLYNNIIWANQAEQVQGQDVFIDDDPNNSGTGVPVVLYNNILAFFETSCTVNTACTENVEFVGNIEADPMLVDTATRPIPDIHLLPNSPAIDAGTNSVPVYGIPTEDIEGDPRPTDGDGDTVAIVDIGADETAGPALPAADLGLTWTHSPNPATGGENVTLSITVTNAGPDEATGVTVNALLDERSTLVSALFNQGNPCTSFPFTSSPYGTQVFCELGAVASNNSVPGTIEITTPVVETMTSLIAEIQVIGNEGDPNGQNNFDENVITLLAAEGPAMADLSITKMDAPDPVFSGGPDLTYTITVENAGPDPATGVTLSDTLPAGVTFVSASATAGQCDTTPDMGGVLNCSLDDLAVTSNTRVTIVVTPDIVTEPVTITNGATVTATEEDPTPGNNTVAEDTVVNPPSADISITTSSTPASPLIDEQITFSLTVSNAGPSNNSGIVVTIVLPPMTTFVSASIDQGSCGEANGVMMLTCAIGDLAAGASVTAQIIVTAPSEAMMVTLSATVVADVDDPTPANNAVSEDVTVIDVIDLVIQGTSKGSGSVGWIELLFLLTLAGVMTARAGWTQLRSGSRALLPVILCAMSAILLMSANEVEAQGNWYVGVSAGTTNLDYSEADLTADLASLGWIINNPKVDDSNTTWKVYAGFEVNDWFAVEAGYVDLGEVITQFGATIPPTQIDALLSDTFSVHPYQGDGWMVAGVARYAFVPDQFSVVGRAGLFAWESKTTVRVISGGTGSVAGDDSGTDAMFGVGVEWQINEQWALTADWERYKLNEWLDVPSIGVKFSF